MELKEKYTTVQYGHLCNMSKSLTVTAVQVV